MIGTLITAAAVLISGQQAPELSVTLVGNAGVLVSDGGTSLLIDLPYESGAFGYMTYDPLALSPPGTVAAVITHHHRDHFDPGLFLSQEDWRVLGPPSVIRGLPAVRVLEGDSVSVGEFEIVSIRTPHTEDHRSYRVRWRGRVLHFAGDTETAAHLSAAPSLDLLFVTPWLSCAASEAGLLGVTARTIAYHLRPEGGDRICGNVEVIRQGATITLPAAVG